MAAVFALVFLFVCASIGFMVKALPDTLSFGSIAMIMTFIAMASGIFVGLYKLARRWEEEVPTGD
jgi:cytochrome c biogenesis protein CcdA